MAPSLITLSPHWLVRGGFNTRMYTLFVASVFAPLPTHQECLEPQNQYSQRPCGHAQTDTCTQQPEFNLSNAQFLLRFNKETRNLLPSAHTKPVTFPWSVKGLCFSHSCGAALFVLLKMPQACAEVLSRAPGHGEAATYLTHSGHV